MNLNNTYCLPSHVLNIQLDENFNLLVNPFVRDGLTIINKYQNNILKQLDAKVSIKNIIQKNSLKKDQLESFISILEKNQIFNEDFLKGNQTYVSKIEGIDFWVHTTDQCNLRCSYCYIRTKDTKTYIDSFTIDKFFDKIVSTVKNHNLKFVKLRLAGGEPFIKFKAWKIKLRELRKTLAAYSCQLNIVFLTNLTLLDNEIIDYIAAENVGIGVSLDGINDFHDSSRSFINGKGSFTQTFKNIDKLIARNIFPTIMIVVSNKNLDGLLDLTKTLVDLHLPFRYSIVQDLSFDYSKALEVFNTVYDYLESQIDNGYDFVNLHAFGELKPIDIHYQNCSSGLNSGTVYTDGNIYFCQQQVGITKPLGSINDKDDLLNMIGKGAKHYGGLHKDCSQCNYRLVCSGGCPIFKENGKNPSCDFNKAIIPMIYYLIGKSRLYKVLNN